MTPLLELVRVSKSFGPVQALQNLSFDLAPGEVHALLGENGAGKSTLIRLITGALQPDSGSIRLDGAELHHLSPARAHRLGIACIYQQPALFQHLTVAENFGLALEPPRPWRRIRWQDRHTRTATLLQRVGARIDPQTEVRHLSMPEQQLVEIARAVGAGARILILDEPTASLTDREVQLLLQTVRDLKHAGTAIVYISHRLEEIFQIADRVTVLRDGQSVASLPVRHPQGDVRPDLSESELIRLMVGRDIAHVYPPPTRTPGPARLQLRALTCLESRVQDVHLEIRQGEIFGLAGLVGSGRTELARILFGLTPADSGEIRLDDQLIRIRSPREAIEHGIAALPEDRRRHGLIGELSAAQNLTLAVHHRLFPGGWLKPRREQACATEFFQRLSIRPPHPELPGAAFSGGNQQKIALGRWLATHPRLLILDEPTQGVDIGAKAEIHRFMRELTSTGLAILLISSDLPEILGMSDRIGVMRQGRLVSIHDGPGADPHTIMGVALGQTS